MNLFKVFLINLLPKIQFLSQPRYVLKTEGSQALFKGVVPTLFGSMPTRAIYFSVYSKFKIIYGDVFNKDSGFIFLFSGISAGLVTSTATSPIWVVKTQMQLYDK